MSKIFFYCSLLCFYLGACDASILQASEVWDDLKLTFPEKGFVSVKPASNWNHALIGGNGTTGVLVYGQPIKETIIFSHENLFLPKAFPQKPIPIARHMNKIRQWILNNEGEKAGEFIVELGQKEGYPKNDFLWPDPLCPAGQLLIKMIGSDPVESSLRSTDFQRAQTTIAWKNRQGIFHRRSFVSREDDIAVVSITSPSEAKINAQFRLVNVPYDENTPWENVIDQNELKTVFPDIIKSINQNVESNRLSLTMQFHQRWPNGLAGLAVVSKVYALGGEINVKNDWLTVKDAHKILILTKVKIYHTFPKDAISVIEKELSGYPLDYQKLLKPHINRHREMFNRVLLDLDGKPSLKQTAETMIQQVSFTKFKPAWIEQIFDAARYAIICSTGKHPPTLQGIWTGTWQPNWSSDYTLNGNVQAAIAFGLNGNFPEVTLAYLDTIESFMSDLHENSQTLFGSDGIMVPARGSVHGLANTYNDEFPMNLWTAGAGWVSQFYYDYWQYTQDKEFLKKRAIPFMLKTAQFYEDFFSIEKDGKLVYVPSYSPEVGPLGYNATITANATMDIAVAKQFFRNLLAIHQEVPLDPKKRETWQAILEKLPDYQVGEDGALKEWIWPGFKNQNEHRHASHLYPLYYENDPEIMEDPKLINASIKAIRDRLNYRRPKQGAEMAFGLVQLGQPAAHLGHTDLAYECLRWLASSYWRSNLVSTHDPGEIFNVDICGGLPALVIDMLFYSQADQMVLLPALPEAWPTGNIKGICARGGFVVDIYWDKGQLISVTIHSLSTRICKIKYGKYVYSLAIKQGQSQTLDGKLNPILN